MDYPLFLHSLCKSENVLIIPKILTAVKNQTKKIKSPTKSKESNLSEKREFVENDEAVSDTSFIQPPQIEIIYETYEQLDEKPTSIVCRNIYIEFSFIHAIEKSLPPFPTITSLKIEDCCISQELAKNLAGILSQGFGKQILDLSLDGNSNIGEIAHLFLSLSNNLKIFSLERCGLRDDDIRLLAESLNDVNKKQQSLLVLNLGINKIGNLGAAYLANALRFNRTLISLSLLGNQIEDEGALRIVEALKRFSLTDEEISCKRRRIFNDILKKSNFQEKNWGKLMEKNETDKEFSKPNVKTLERSGATSRKFRGIDGKSNFLSSDKKNKQNMAKLSSEEKSGGKIKQILEENEKNLVENVPGFLMRQNLGDNSSDYYLFVNELFTSDGILWCKGCWSLLNLNLAYNNLSEKIVNEFVDVLFYQCQTFKFPQEGLMKLTISPGNFIKEGSREMINLEKAIKHKVKKKLISETHN